MNVMNSKITVMKRKCIWKVSNAELQILNKFPT